jgi:NAD(P)-dependent dehydrogenase (short-subunit alcohol dehydrogenase family)
LVRLEGKVAIVTGAAQGIGAELARGLSALGADIVVADVLEGHAVAEAIDGNGGRAIFCSTDITDDAALAATVKAAEDRFGGIDILVNNAALFGTLPPTPLMELDNDAWDRVMRVNARGIWQAAKAVIPAMERRGGGAIVNIATNRVFHGFPNLLHYDASKGAVLAMTKAMAMELGPRSIRVNAIAPGLTMSENVLAKTGIEERNEKVVRGRALARSQQPEDLIGAVAFFASDASGFVSGQSLIVDGGGIMV